MAIKGHEMHLNSAWLYCVTYLNNHSVSWALNKKVSIFSKFKLYLKNRVTNNSFDSKNLLPSTFLT